MLFIYFKLFLYIHSFYLFFILCLFINDFLSNFFILNDKRNSDIYKI